jgi:hypothetical protein
MSERNHQKQRQRRHHYHHHQNQHHERCERRSEGGECDGRGNDNDKDDDDDNDDDPYTDVSSMSGEERARDIKLQRRTSSSSIDGCGLEEDGGKRSFSSKSSSPGCDNDFDKNDIVVTNNIDDEIKDDGGDDDDDDDDDDDHESRGRIETSLAWCTSLTNSSTHTSPASTFATTRRNGDDANGIHDDRLRNNINDDGRDIHHDDDDDDDGYLSNNNDNNGDGSGNPRLRHHRSNHHPNTQATLKRATAVTIIPSPPSTYASSPLGGDGSAGSNHDEYDGNVKTPNRIVLPRFYDSEDDGVGGSVVFVDTPSSSAMTMVQMHTQACNQVSNSNTINSNASGTSVAERTSIRNLFMQTLKRQGSSGSLVRFPESPSYLGAGTKGKEDDDGSDVYDDDDLMDDSGSVRDEIVGVDEEFSPPPHLMPYQQRKRLSAREVGEAGGTHRQRRPAGVTFVLPNGDMNPPADALASTDVSGINPPSSPPQMTILNVATSGHRQQGRVLHPPSPLSPSPPSPHSPPPPSQHQNQPPILASKYRIAPIPPFRGRGASTLPQNPKERRQSSSAKSNYSAKEDANSLEGGEKETMRKVKSAMASSNAATAPPSPTPERKRKMQQGSHGAKQQIRTHSSEGNRPPRAPPQHPHPQQQHQQHQQHQQQQQQHHQEVIDSNFPPSASHHSPVSPRGGVGSSGYHIRISSQGSVSSLGSNAAGADDIPVASTSESIKLHHADSREHKYYMQQQKRQQEQLWQQHHTHHHPGQQQQQQQQQHQLHPNYNVNYNALLGREVAQFLHGEHVAKAAERNQQLHQQYHRQERHQPRHSYNPNRPPAPPHGRNSHHHNATPQWVQPQQQQQYGWYTGSHEHLNQHIHIFTPPTTWDAHSNDVAHHHLYQRQVYSPSESEDEGDDFDPLINKSKYSAGIRDDNVRKSGSQQRRQMKLNRYDALPPSASIGQSDLGQVPSNQRLKYYHSDQQGGNVHWNDRRRSDEARRPQQQHSDAHVEESLPSEKSPLLHGGGKYFEYRIDNNVGGRGGGRIQHHGIPPQNAIPSEGAPPSISTKKKKSKRRRHYKVRKWMPRGLKYLLPNLSQIPLAFMHFLFRRSTITFIPLNPPGKRRGLTTDTTVEASATADFGVPKQKRRANRRRRQIEDVITIQARISAPHCRQSTPFSAKHTQNRTCLSAARPIDRAPAIARVSYNKF